MKRRPLQCAAPVLMVVTVCAVWWVNAGSLTPPPGPISSTMKDLATVEPRTAIRNDFVNIIPIVISEPGSYYLAEDIYAIHSQHGIEITTSNVTLDLMGFTIYGNTEVGSLDGIRTTGTRNNITIRNGVISSFFGDGIDLFSSSQYLIENILTTNNGNDGMRVGFSGVVRNCVANQNGGFGILTASYVVVSHSSASNNGGIGIKANQGSVVSDCSASSNFGTGFDIALGTLVNCASFQNVQDGIVATGSTITGCTMSNNGGDGIEVDFSCHVHGNTSRLNQAGIHVINRFNRIDSNNVMGNIRGIDVDNTTNVIVRNTSINSSVSNYDIVVGNDVGPIGTAAASTSPWANISQ